MSTYFDDCSSLSAWTEAGLVAGTDYSVSGGAIVKTASNLDMLKLSAVDSDAERQDCEVLVKVKISSVSTTHYVAIVRGTDGGSVSTSNGYLVALRSTAIRTFKKVNGTITQISEQTGKTHSANTDYWVRLRINSTTLRARSWADGSGEPGTWDCDATNSDITGDGYAGLHGTANTATHTWSACGVGTNGDTAPSSAGNSYNVSLTETGSPSDTASAVATWARSIDESVSATDTATRTIVAVVESTEAASATDTVTTGTGAYEVSVTEAASATDAASAIATLLASASETLAASDAFTVAGVYGRSVSEAASATDAANWGGAFYSVDIAETASLADAVSAALSALAASVEAGNATDALSVLVTGGTAAVAESAAAADALTTTAQLVAALTEPGSATDLFSASASGDLLGELIEAAAATDAYVVAVVRGIAVLTVRPMQPRSSGLLRPANLSGRGR